MKTTVKSYNALGVSSPAHFFFSIYPAMPIAPRPVALPTIPIAATFPGFSRKPLRVILITREEENVCIEPVVNIEYVVKLCDMFETLMSSTVTFLVSVLLEVFSCTEVVLINWNVVSTDG